MIGTSTRMRAAGALAIACFAVTGCGWGDDDPETAQADPDSWRAEASEACEAGTREAVALPLPQSRGEVVEDARAMAGILTTARDSIASLGAPSELESGAGAYLAELDEDIAILEEIVRDGPPRASAREEGAMLLDESAGQAALDLDLPACAAFSNAVARTP